jgi:uncharacterized protein (DUF1015 family)
MPAFAPFRALRYDRGLVALEDVVAPPYDVVDDAERARLAARSPFNAIHLELPEPDLVRGLDRYSHAAALLDEWRRRGILRLDDVPSLTVYVMQFTSEDGRRRATTGVLGAIRLEPDGEQVLPHEETMPKPRSDRLDLLRATRANLSPIWGLSPARGLGAACRAAAEDSPLHYAAVDDDGVRHECFVVADERHITVIGSLVASTPLILADGHHRYETAVRYLEMVRSTAGAAGDAARGADHVLGLVVELAEEELAVAAIHRLVSGLPADLDLPAALARWFTAEPATTDPEALRAETLRRKALGLLTRSGAWLLHPTPELVAAAGDQLDSRLLARALADLPPHELAYEPRLTGAARSVAAGLADAAFLLRPASVAQIAATAASGRRLPPKTTFFEPKPRTGMAFRLLDA